jgi:hypothetical protein
MDQGNLVAVIYADAVGSLKKNVRAFAACPAMRGAKILVPVCQGLAIFSLPLPLVPSGLELLSVF